MPIAAKEKKTPRKTVPKTVSKPIEARQPSEADFVVIETGGKQYGVAVGSTIKIEKIPGEHKVGDKITFDKVLLIDGSTVNLGAPYVAGAKVEGRILEIGRNKKVTVIHYKQKSRYFKKAGHRQPFLKIKIEKIG